MKSILTTRLESAAKLEVAGRSVSWFVLILFI